MNRWISSTATLLAAHMALAAQAAPTGAEPPSALSLAMARALRTDPSAVSAVGGATASGDKSPRLAFAASALLPGAGQIYGSRPVSAGIFMGLEALTVGGYLFMRSEGDARETDFQRYAQNTAGAATAPPDDGHDFDKYYEDLIKSNTTWSGNFYRYDGGFDWDPPASPFEQEIEADFLDFYNDFYANFMTPISAENDSYNQVIWNQAMEENWAPGRAAGGEYNELERFYNEDQVLLSSVRLGAAYADYLKRAFQERWSWNWAYADGDDKTLLPTGDAKTRALANLKQYRALRDKANVAYKQATFVGGLALFNHVVSAIHAAKGASLKNQENAGRTSLNFGVNPDVTRPEFRVRLTRAFD